MLGSMRYALLDAARDTHALSLLAQLERIQFESPEQLHERAMIEREAYFRTLRENCSLFTKCKRFEDLPVIDKLFVNHHRGELLNPAFRGRLLRKQTGGSTRTPFVYYTGTRTQSYLWAGILLSWRVAGYRLGEPVAFLVGPAFSGLSYAQLIYYKLLNVRIFSAFEMDGARLNAYGDAISRGGFRLLYGYASAIHLFALHLLSLPKRRRFALRAVVCTSDVLTAAMRETIERAFGVPCFNQYGCNDAGVSAYECGERKGFHLLTTRCYPEVLEGGRFISTDLSNDAFFLPRYDTGDLVSMSRDPCRCGRGFPLIRELHGRANDLVKDQAGNMFHHMYFMHLFRDDARIAAFQVIYDDRQLTVIIHCREAGTDWGPYVERIRAAMVFSAVRVVENQRFVRSSNAKQRLVLRVDDVDETLGRLSVLEW
ncbi:MAG TPA: hypothetical protein VGE12_14335 [Noviherbaspirillum sp.]